MMKFIQWNAHKSLDSSGSSELNTILINENIQIAILQEMGSKEYKPSFPSREWTCYGSGNAGLLIHRSIRSVALPQFTCVTPFFTSAAAIAYIDGFNVPIAILSVYRNHLVDETAFSNESPPSNSSKSADPNIFLNWIEETISQLPAVTEAYIIGGDFNIKSTELGSLKDDKASSRLTTIGLALQPDGGFLNDGSFTRHHWDSSSKHIDSSAIDLTLAYSSSASAIIYSDWKTNGQGVSDHMRITFNATSTNPIPLINQRKHPGFRKQRHGEGAAQELVNATYREILTRELESKGWAPSNPLHLNTIPHLDPDITIKELTHTMLSSALEATFIQVALPLRKFPLSHSRNYAWNEECDKKLKVRRKCKRRLAEIKIQMQEKSTSQTETDWAKAERLMKSQATNRCKFRQTLHKDVSSMTEVLTEGIQYLELSNYLLALKTFNQIIDSLINTNSIANMLETELIMFGWSLSYRAKCHLLRAQTQKGSCLSLGKQAIKDCLFVLQNPNFKKECLPTSLIHSIQLNLTKASSILQSTHFQQQAPENSSPLDFDIISQHLVIARTNFNKSVSDLRKEISKASEDSWKKAISSINSETPINDLWNTVKKLGRKVTKRPSHVRPFLVKDRNQIVQSQPTEQAKSLATNWEFVSKNDHESYNISHFQKITHAMENMKPKISPIIPRDRVEAVNMVSELPVQSGAKWQSRITLEEVENAISNSNSRSAPGDDSITYEMIKLSGSKFNMVLLNIFNYCWATGQFPSCWKKGVVIAIPKTAEAISVSDFRPITLLSCLGKLYEKIISERLRYILEVSNALSPYQFGFRSNKSSPEQLIRIVQDVHSGWEQGMDTLFVSFDVKKAFDTMWHDGLLFKLNELGVDGRMLRWIASFLNKRPSKVCVDGCVSEQYLTNSGVPQGGVLSPLLFVIYNNDSLNGLSESIKCSLFADDTAIYAHIPREKGSLRDLRLAQFQSAIDKVMKWSSLWRLQQGKAKCMVFHQHTTINSRSGEDSPKLLMNGNSLPINQQTPLRFLGLYMDPRLDLGWHIDIVLCKAKMRLNVLKSFSYKRQNCDQLTLRQLYIAWIRPLIEYCPIAIATATSKNLKKLDQFQYEALRLITGASRTVSSRALHVETDIEPLSQRRMIAGGRQLAKITRHSQQSVMLIEWERWKIRPDWHNGLRICPELPVDPHDHVKLGQGAKKRLSPFHFMQCVYFHLNFFRDDVGVESLAQHLTKPPWRFNYQKDNSTHQDDTPIDWPKFGPANKRDATQKFNAWKYSMEVIAKAKAYPGQNLVMYCDGSAHTDALGGGGVGTVIQMESQLNPQVLSIPTGLLSSNSSTECLGILTLTAKAKQLTEEGTNFDNFHIFSDSQTFVNLSRAGNAGRKGIYWKSLKRIETLKRLIRRNGKRWTCWWTPGHIGNKLNDMVDEAAKIGAQQSRNSLVPFSQMLKPYVLVKSFLRKRLNRRYQIWWTNTNHARESHLLRPIIEQTIPDEYKSEISRKHQIIISRARMNNVTTNATECRDGHLADPQCDYCTNVQDSFDHRMFDCPHYATLRWKFKRKIRMIQPNLPFTKKTILTLEGAQKQLRKRLVHAICDFLEQTKLDDLFIGHSSSQ